jgi:hypothetical protein
MFGRVARLGGAPRAAIAACTEAVAVANRCDAAWFAALARAELAAAFRDVGDTAAAEQARNAVAEWAAGPLATQGREFFFVVLGGDPAELAAAT